VKSIRLIPPRHGKTMRWLSDSYRSDGRPLDRCPECAAPEDGGHTVLACLRGRRWTRRFARRLAAALAAISRAIGGQ
jgi:hypothetical protein